MMMSLCTFINTENLNVKTWHGFNRSVVRKLNIANKNACDSGHKMWDMLAYTLFLALVFVPVSNSQCPEYTIQSSDIDNACDCVRLASTVLYRAGVPFYPFNVGVTSEYGCQACVNITSSTLAESLANGNDFFDAGNLCSSGLSVNGFGSNLSPSEFITLSSSVPREYADFSNVCEDSTQAEPSSSAPDAMSVISTNEDTPSSTNEDAPSSPPPASDQGAYAIKATLVWVVLLMFCLVTLAQEDRNVQVYRFISNTCEGGGSDPIGSGQSDDGNTAGIQGDVNEALSGVTG